MIIDTHCHIENVDYDNLDKIISKLKDYNMTIIVVSHELNFVKDFSSRIIFLDNKTIISDDTVKGTFSSENEIIKNFLKDIN